MDDRGSGGEAAPLSARRLVERLVDLGATHVVGLPDNASAPLFDLLEPPVAVAGLDAPSGAVSSAPRDRPRLVPVTREGEAFALASGLWIGGARPVVVVQNTGLLESGDSLRGTAMRMGVPLLVLVTWRGRATLERHDAPAPGPVEPREDGIMPGLARPRPPRPVAAGEAMPWIEPALDRTSLVRRDVDSVALLTEPTLFAWSVPFVRVEGGADLDRVTGAWRRAWREERPVAALLTRGLAP